MFPQPYYHALVKKIIIGFGNLFSNIQIQRMDNAGVVAETVLVPIAYGPKEKVLRVPDENPDQTHNTYITLPRLSFEIEGYQYDQDRKVNRNNKITIVDDNGKQSATYAPVPYNIDITLYLLTKGTEDGLAVLEQILPLFSPEYTLRIKPVDTSCMTIDVPIVLNNATVQDDWEGDFSTRRLVIHTFNFTAKANLFGPMLDRTNKTILRTDTTLPEQNEVHTSKGDPLTNKVTVDEWNNIGEAPL